MSFSFGSPASAPATGITGGFSFGANKPATPGFGLTATSQPSTGLFGSTPPTSTPAFGATSTPAFGATATPAFGATSTPAFGATSTPAFGATSTSAFGATSTPAFGATSTPAFGATSAPAFGATTTPAFGATSAPAFGATTTPAFGSTGFGASAAPAFGAGTSTFGASSAAPTFGGGGLNFGAGTTTTAASGLSFGAPATTVGLGGLSGFGFGGTTAQNTGLGLLGASTSTAASSGPFATSGLGLGGAAPNVSGIGTTNSTDNKDQQPKQTKLPNELTTSVDSFKEFVKKQKSLSSDIMRVSIKPLHKVGRSAEEMVREVLSLSGEVGRARAQSKRLRTAAAAALTAAENAARDIPGSELEGSAPPSYVKEILLELEQQLITFRRQMDVADKQMQASPKLLSEQELTLGIRRMHEAFVALAARLQAVHSQVEAQKEQYLNLRKYVLKDPTNVFEDTNGFTSLDQIIRDAEGGRKKLKTIGYLDSTRSSAVLSDPRIALGNLQHLAGPPPFTYLGTTVSPHVPSDTSSNWHQPHAVQQSFMSSDRERPFGTFRPTGTIDVNSSSAFQLQKPPKRGKQ